MTRHALTLKLNHLAEADQSRMWRLIGINTLVLAVLLALAEAALAWLGTRSAPLGVGALDKVARKLYWANVSYVQFEPDCAQYDAQLGYTLRPGNCTFENAVFSTEISVNSAGLRDDEASLLAPQIIVLGDSQAMGWGVENGQAFADVIEAETGKRTLNAGVSSYATARELLMLSRLDRSNLETVVIQYSDNDAWENRTYLATGGLEAMSPESYQTFVEKNAGAGKGFGVYLSSVIRIFAEEFEERTNEAENRSGGDEALMPLLPNHDVFLEILSSWTWDNPPPLLILLDVNTGGRGGGFIQALATSPKLAELQAKGLNVITMDTSEFLEPHDYLFPDGHLTAEGQRKIGMAVTEALAGLY
jgi:lysophospholipase L1-like esterase